MGLFDDLYGAYNQQVSPVATPSNPLAIGTPLPKSPDVAVVPQGNPLHTLIASLLAPQPQTVKPVADFAALIKALRRVPHLGTGGGEITPSNPTGNEADPWGVGGLFANNLTHRAALASLY